MKMNKLLKIEVMLVVIYNKINGPILMLNKQLINLEFNIQIYFIFKSIYLYLYNINNLKTYYFKI